MTPTTNLALRKPASSEYYAVGDQNYNMDVLDTAVAGKAMAKAGSDTFTSGGTTKVVTDAFITTSTFVSVSPTSNKAGVWSVSSASGSFTVTSDTTETINVTFDWFASKPGV